MPKYYLEILALPKFQNKMKGILFLMLLTLLFLPFNDVFSQSVNLPDVEIDKIQRVALETSDLIILDLKVKNNQNVPISIYSSSIVLTDTTRVFEHVSLFHLNNQKEVSLFDVSCKTLLFEDIQPGLTSKINDLCFQVPQERNLQYKLIIAESNYEYCNSTNQFLKQECKVLTIGAIPISVQDIQEITSKEKGGCLIATAAYGTELAPQVQNLREIRNKMYDTQSGGQIMHTVNDFYYSFSPTISDWQRENMIFNKAVQLLITPSISSFAIIDHQNISSEDGLIGYVLGVVFLNLGMYFIVPAMLFFGIRKIHKSTNS